MKTAVKRIKIEVSPLSISNNLIHDCVRSFLERNFTIISYGDKQLYQILTKSFMHSKNF